MSNFVHREQIPALPKSIVHLHCPSGSVEHAWLPPLENQSYASVSAPHGICVTLIPHRASVVATNGRHSERDLAAGCMSTAGPEPIHWLLVREPSDVVEVTGTAAVRSAIAEELRVPTAVELEDRHGVKDCVAWAIASRLRSALRHHGPASLLECDQLIWQLYRHVFSTRFGGRLREKGDGKLDRRRLDRVTAYIEEHLADSDLGIAVLARVAALSPFHFLRSFKRTVHMTPHSFVRGRRLERIRAAVANGGDPLEAARRYGFMHVRHFRSQYRQHYGLSLGQDP